MKDGEIIGVIVTLDLSLCQSDELNLFIILFRKNNGYPL
jgi:hypothetical protein